MSESLLHTHGTRMVPASFAQERLWILDHLAPNMPVYNIPVAIQCAGSLQLDALSWSLNHIIQRHEALRTSFTEVEGHLMQVIVPSLTLDIPITDLQQEPGDEHKQRLHVLLTEEAHRPFDLAQPLLRAALFKVAAQDHVLLLTFHHSIFDGWSLSLFCEEFTTLYEAFVAGHRSPFPPLPTQYADYALWQREWLQGSVLQNLLTYWTQQLQGMPSFLPLPTDHPRPVAQSFRGARHYFQFSEELTSALYQLARRERVTLFMILLAAFQMLLYRYTRAEDICVGTPIAGRTQEDVEDLIGFFVNTLVLRTQLSGRSSFREVLQRVQVTALEAYAHQDLPFEKLVEEMQHGRDLSYHPLFQVLFVLQNTPPKHLSLPGLTMRFLEVERKTAKCDLLLEMQETDGQLGGNFEYSTDLFDLPTIIRMSHHFQVLVEAIVLHPEQPLQDLPLVTEAEREQLLVEWNSTLTDYPKESCIHHLFDAQAQQTPQNIAVMYGDEQLTYAQVASHSNQLAHYLQSLGVGPGILVGLCMERCPAFITAIIAILKAGAAYVPLDPTYPQARLAFMVADTGMHVLLTQQHLSATLPKHMVHIVCLDTARDIIEQQETCPLSHDITAMHTAYVMYTSGSTGTAKGVSVTHRNVIRLVRGTNYMRFSPHEVFLQFASISFDASTFEIWGCLLHGATLVLFPAYTPSLEELAHFIQQQHITTLWLTAGLFHHMIENHLEAFQHVRHLLAGGDVLSVTHVRKALQALPECQIINGYGPTENTTFTCCYTVPRSFEIERSVPIGYPIANTHVYILDPNHHLMPIGVPGELYVGGDGLASGYLHRPELTAERFIPHPFSEERGARLYKTGDIARYLPDGAIEFLGRNDTQVKIRGFRVELGEIEATLSEHPAVQEVLVQSLEHQHGEKALVAYVVMRESASLTRKELKGYAQTRLPDYMVPSSLVFLNAFPLTTNGKVDRSLLPHPDFSEREEDASSFAPPRNMLEAQITQMFEDVLHRHPIGVADDFFEQGGHSLSAMRLLSRLQKRFGQSISLPDFFQAATVEALARRLRPQASLSHYHPLIGIQPKGSRPPFLCIHPADGNIFCYVALAHQLGGDQPFYAIEEPFFFDNWKHGTCVEEMAADYIQLLRAFQPSGPYYLGGYSFGGTIAFEMAYRLSEQGEKVALLALIDTFSPLVSSGASDRDETSIIAGFASYLAEHWPGLPKDQFPEFLSEDEIRRLDQEHQWHYLLQFAKVVNFVSSEEELPLLRRWVHIYKNHVQAAQNYNPTFIYQNQITLFRATQRRKDVPSDLDETLRWKEFSSEPVDVHVIPGKHSSLLKEPNVRILSEHLRYCLEMKRSK